VVRNNIRLGSDQLKISAVVDLRHQAPGVFTLRWPCRPAIASNKSSATGFAMVRTDRRQCAPAGVALKERTGGNYSLRLELTRSLKELPKSLAVEGVCRWIRRS